MPITDISVPFRQTSKGWSVAHAMANLFREPAILNLTGVDETADSGGDEAIDKMLSIINPNLCIADIMFLSPQYGVIDIPGAFKVLTVSEDQNPDFPEVKNILTGIPYLVTMHIGPSIFHTVAAINTEFGLFWIDPIREKVHIVNDHNELNELLANCCSIQRPMINTKTMQNFLMMNLEKFGWAKFFIPAVADLLKIRTDDNIGNSGELFG